MNREAFHDCRAILFDFGGTLDSDGEHWLTRFFALYAMAGFSLDQGRIKDAFYHAVDSSYHDPRVASLDLRRLVEYQVQLQFQALGISESIKEKEVARHFWESSEAFLTERTLLFNRLHTRYRLGVVSNFYGNLDIILRDWGVAQYLEFIIDSNRVGIRKPDPGIFSLALKRLGLPSGQVIFVGDSYERDMEPAHRSGMKTVWLRTEQKQVPWRDGFVDATISRLRQLEELLL